MIQLLSLYAKHERRIRLTFSNILAGGAFVAAPYTVLNQDGKGPNIAVSAALPVSGDVYTTELSLAADMVLGAVYRVTAVGVPALDASVTPGGTQLLLWFQVTPKAPLNSERPVTDRELVLYGADLVWNGVDYVESPTGDLARVQGVPNVAKAILRGATEGYLTYDPSWGARAREYVDSPAGGAENLQGALMAQALKDPRVKGIKIIYEQGETSGTFHLSPKLFSGEAITPVDVVLPNV